MEKLPILLIVVVFLSLATSSNIRNGRLSGADRMNDPQIKQCLSTKYCITTDDLTPTCGSDGRTYPNGGSIDCLNECLTPENKVKIISRGYCEGDVVSST